MSKLFGVIAQIAFYVFVVIVGAWTISLTLAEVRAILPGDPLTPYFALALFDGGAIAWLGAWLKVARGVFQKAIALLLLVLDLGGVVLLSAGRLLGGGQTMTDVPETLGQTVVYGVIIYTALNLIAAYAFHVMDPENIEEIETGILEDTLREEALNQAKANVEAQAQALGAILAARATGRLKYKLRLPIGDTEIAALDGEALPALPETVTPTAITTTRSASARTPNPIANWIVRLAQRMRGAMAPQPEPVTVYESTATATAPRQVTPDGQTKTQSTKHNGPAPIPQPDPTDQPPQEIPVNPTLPGMG